MDENLRILEALLFAAAEPLRTQDLHERMPEGADVGGLLMELQKLYDGRGVELVDLDGAWAFRTAKDLAEALSVERHITKKMSKAALETLSIIAYHQPVTRAEVENIRGVATHRGTLDSLIEAGWVKPGRRRETPGRPLTWVTTTSFLDQFGLESIMDLPGLDDLKASGLLDRRPAIEAASLSGDLFGDEAEERALAQDLNRDDLKEEDAPEDMLEEL